MREWTGRTSPTKDPARSSVLPRCLLVLCVSDQGRWERSTEEALNFLTLYLGGEELGGRVGGDWQRR